MQLETLNRTVGTAGIATQKKMDLILDGTAFKILSDGLYSDKIGSLVRETYSNVIDSHIMAGQPDKPGWIQLPNALDPTYVVRDEGIGLDAEGVMETATTYFKSTKRADNSAIGGFGLGFKSPFAYTDQWIIVATKDATRRTFSAYMNEDGEPNVAMLSEEPTNEPNGVEVRVPVKRNDIQRFADAVKTQLQFFKPRPIITGTKSEWPETEAVLETEKFRLMYSPTNRGYGHSGSGHWYALIGPIAFKIDQDQLRSHVSGAVQSLLRGTSGQIMFEVGEISPAPSRETLQYNDRTIKALLARLEEVSGAFAAQLTKEADAAPTYWEAMLRFRQVHSALGYTLRSIINGITYKGRKLDTSVDFKTTTHLGLYYSILEQSDLKKDRCKLDSFYDRITLEARPGTFVFIDDLPSVNQRQAARIKHWFEADPTRQTTVERVIILRPGKPEHDVLALSKAFLVTLGDFPQDRVFKLSEVEPPAIQRTVVAGVKISLPPGIRVVTNRNHVSPSMASYADAAYVSVPVGTATVTPGFYVVTEHNSFPQDGDLIAAAARCEALFPGKLHFVPKTVAHRIKAEDGWVEFTAHVKAYLDSRKDEINQAIQLLGTSDALSMTRSMCCADMMNRFVVNGVEPAARRRSVNAFQRMYREWHRISSIKVSEDLKVLTELSRKADYEAHQKLFEVTKAKALDSLCDLYNKFETECSLLHAVLGSTRHGPTLNHEFAVELVKRLA